MPLDPQFLLGPSLEMYFVNKATGLPLAGGYVYFYSDVNRTTPKNVYQISGTPPNYSYTALPNPVQLSSVGTIQNAGGDNVLPYYKPYDPDGNVELYYIEVYSGLKGAPGSVPQFTRAGWPNTFTDNDTTSNAIANFVPNPQFIIHNTIFPANTWAPDEGKISDPNTEVAPGGWIFQRPAGSTAEDYVIFQRFGSYTPNPAGSPRYAINPKCLNPDPTNVYKQLLLKFPDVNKFSSPSANPTQYTFSFTGTSPFGAFTVGVYLVKNYGTGGSAQDETLLFNANITSGYAIQQTSFTFGDNSGKTIGNNNDDYVGFLLKFNVGATFNIILTDFILTPGIVTISGFPAEPDCNYISKSTIGYSPLKDAIADIPNYNLYLPFVRTNSGGTFWDGFVSYIFGASYDAAPPFPFVACDGSTLATNSYSPEGIPYARCQAKLYNSTTNMPRYGTGPDYCTSYIQSGTPTQVILTNNREGPYTVINNGPTSSGCTLGTCSPGFSLGGKFISYISGGNIYVQFTEAGNEANIPGSGWAPPGTPLVNNTGLTLLEDPNFPLTTYTGSVYLGPGKTPPQFFIEPKAASTITAGHYFDFISPIGTRFYLWFKINGAGSDPAPGGTGIECNLLSTDTALVVAQKIAMAMNGWQVSTIVTVAGSSISPGGSIKVTVGTSTGSQEYYFWFSVGGTGTPGSLPGSSRSVRVDVLSADTAAQIATKLMAKINSQNFATPNYNGLVLRGTGGAAWQNPDKANRWSFVPGLIGDVVGTYERDLIYSHNHNLLTEPLSAGPGSVDIPSTSLTVQKTGVDYFGGIESRPKTASIKWVMFI